MKRLDKKYCLEEYESPEHDKLSCDCLECTDYRNTDSNVSELQFALLQVEYLLSVLNELESISDTLQKKIIDNAKERHYLDKLIHAKLLFK